MDKPPIIEPYPLTFSAVYQYLKIDPHYQIGPRPAINDYRFAAGILFEHYNDGSRRILHNPYLGNPYIEVTWYHDFSNPDWAKAAVTPKVVEQLRHEGVIEGVPYWGGRDKYKFILSDRGMRRVIEEWFTEDRTLHNILSAGATIDLAEGKVVWK